MPRKRTLTELCREVGMRDAAPDDPIYRTKFGIYLRAPSQKPTKSQPESSETGELPDKLPNKLIDMNSKDPKDR
jgi:hypothetical protein